jgi:hypothetical protein
VKRAFLGPGPRHGPATTCFALVGSHHGTPFRRSGGHQRQQPATARLPSKPGDP